ncbi:LysR substrate-binding domain-containing protein [Acidisoma sp. 7E03]
MLMIRPASLDPDLLRSFVLIAEERSFTRAAQVVGRTQSAVSMQMQRLEGTLGQQLFHRGRGGSVELTRHGQFLLERAREMLALNDDIWRTFHEPSVSGSVRLGTPDDYALRFLPRVLMRFSEVHPSVEVEVVCAPSNELVPRVQAGALDLALVSEGESARAMEGEPLWRGPLVWVGSTRHVTHRLDPLPLALSDPSCCWRAAAEDALQTVGRRYRVAYSSAAQIGTLAPVLAGLAITISPATALPEGLVMLGPEEGLPPLPDFQVMMIRAREARQPVTDALATFISEVFLREAGRPGLMVPELAA